MSNRPGVFIVDLSLVVPLYNEEESVPLLHSRVCEACDELGIDWEVIYVDDGSSDQTWAALQQLVPGTGSLVSIQLHHNTGQTPAMAAGFEAARGRYVITMDGDLQNDPADVGMMLEAAREGFDLVCGWRKNRQDKLWSRKIPSLCANWLIRKITKVHIHDYGCSLKIYDRALVKRMRLYADMHRFLPFVAQQAGARVGERVVRHHARQFGVSKYGIGRTWKVLLDLIGLKLLVHYIRMPLVMFGVAAVPFFVVGTGVALWALLQAELRGPVVFGSSFLLVSVGVLVAASGLLGQSVATRESTRIAALVTNESDAKKDWAS